MVGKSQINTNHLKQIQGCHCLLSNSIGKNSCRFDPWFAPFCSASLMVRSITPPHVLLQSFNAQVCLFPFFDPFGPNPQKKCGNFSVEPFVFSLGFDLFWPVPFPNKTGLRPAPTHLPGAWWWPPPARHCPRSPATLLGSPGASKKLGITWRLMWLWHVINND